MKKGLQKAVEKYSSRGLKKQTKKREHPEKELEKEVMTWAKEYGFDLTVVDSSGYGTWDNKKVGELGVTDLIGNYKALSVWIELKAKGKLSTIRYDQYKFLERKAQAGCFAVCVDSVDLLKEIWSQWLYKKTVGQGPIEYLLDVLPKGAKVKAGDHYDRPLFG